MNYGANQGAESLSDKAEMTNSRPVSDDHQAYQPTEVEYAIMWHERHYDIEETMMDWISVKDRLPKKTHRVLVAYKKSFNLFRGNRRQVYEARYSGGAWRFLSPNLKTRKSSHVTHWMPLPLPPSGDEQP